MNDTYVEQLVSRKKSPMLSVARFILYGFAIALVLFSLLAGYPYLIAGIILGAVAYFVLPSFDVEYEYLYLSKEITIDKITSQQRRKTIETIDLAKAEIIAPANSHELDSYKNRNLATKDYTSGEADAKAYMIAYIDGENSRLISFEPDEEMLSAIKSVYPRKLKEY